MRKAANRLWHIKAEVWDMGGNSPNEMVDKKVLASDAAEARNWITNYATDRGMWVLKLDLMEVEMPAGVPVDLKPRVQAMAPARLPAPSPKPCTYKAKPDRFAELTRIPPPHRPAIIIIGGGEP